MAATPLPALDANHAAPFQSVAAVTAADADLTRWPTRALFIGTAGNVTVTMADGTTAVHKNLANGSILPGEFKQVNAATTAADIVAWY
jgi:hypothetical protein